MLTSLRSLLREAARSLGVERAAYTAQIVELWSEVAGEDAAGHSRPRDLRAGVLTVEVEAGPWVQEISARRGGYVAEINRRLGAPAVAEIRVAPVVGRPAAAPAAAEAEAGAAPAAGAAALTPEETAEIERVVAEIADPQMREAARKAMRSQLAWRKRHVHPPGR